MGQQLNLIKIFSFCRRRKKRSSFISLLAEKKLNFSTRNYSTNFLLLGLVHMAVYWLVYQTVFNKCEIFCCFKIYKIINNEINYAQNIERSSVTVSWNVFGQWSQLAWGSIIKKLYTISTVIYTAAAAAVKYIIFY